MGFGGWLGDKVGGAVGGVGGAIGYVGGTMYGGIGGAVAGNLLGRTAGNKVLDKALGPSPADDSYYKSLSDQYGFSDKDLEEFKLYNDANGYDVNLLKGASGTFKKDNNSLTQAFGGDNQVNDNIPGVLKAFLAWKDKRDAAMKDHNAYVDASRANPGRDATILTPRTPSLDQRGTINKIALPTAPKKTAITS